MTRIVVLDTGPLGKVTNPKSTPENKAAAAWLKHHSRQGTRLIVPEIANYELRRELLRGNKTNGLKKLDALIATVEYLPLSTAMIYAAAEYWAQARKAGIPTAHEHALDGDMLLIAQVRSLNDPGAIVATVDVGDLNRFILADLWSNILP